MRNTVCLLGAVCFAATVSIWTDPPVHGQVCAGDCNADQAITIDELITCVRVALSVEDLATCEACDVDADGMVAINELIASVLVALGNYDLQVNGQCVQPCTGDDCAAADHNKLVPCTMGTRVEASGCDADGNCGQAAVGATVQPGGTFNLKLCLSTPSPLQLKSDETEFRVIDLGSAGARHSLRSASAAAVPSGLGPPSLEVRLSPASEATARLLIASGLSQFDAAGAEQVSAAVETALADTIFADLDAAAAAVKATDTAGAAPDVQAAIENNRRIAFRIGDGSGERGGTTQIALTLATGGIEIAGTQNDIMFTADARIAALPDGSPDCAVNPAIHKTSSVFTFTPSDCSGTACTGMRALVLDLANTDPIPQGSKLYTCTIAISPQAPTGSIPLTCGEAIAASPDGTDMEAQCTAGAVTVTN